MSLSDEERIRILADPRKVPGSHKEKLHALRTAIKDKMALYEKDVIIAELVKLGLEKAVAAILVVSIIDKAPTPVYVLKDSVRSMGDSFVLKYPENMKEWHVNGRNTNQVAKKLELPAELIVSMVSANISLLNNCARGMPRTVLREHLQEAGISDDTVEIIIQVLETHYEQWQNTILFANIQDTKALVSKAILQNDSILDILKDILKGNRPSDQPYVR